MQNLNEEFNETDVNEEKEQIIKEESEEQNQEKINEEILDNLQYKMNLEQSFANGISWFYWIAALSVINTIVFVTGNDWNFIIGLGITQLVDYAAYEITGGISYLAIGIDILIAGIFFMIGFFANRKRKNWIIVIGLILYALDAFIFLFVQDWFSIAFHVWAIYGMFKAIKVNNKLMELERA